MSTNIEKKVPRAGLETARAATSGQNLDCQVSAGGSAPNKKDWENDEQASEAQTAGRSPRRSIGCLVVDAAAKSRVSSRFWSKVDRSAGSDGCWLWQGGGRGTGYGCIKIDGKVIDSHRVAYALAHGCTKAGLVVMHACDVRACCNPAHLRLGTLADNVADMAAKGRRVSPEAQSAAAKARGQKPPRHEKLTLTQVVEIRSAVASGEHPTIVAARYDVHRTTAVRIGNGTRWPLVSPLTRRTATLAGVPS